MDILDPSSPSVHAYWLTYHTGPSLVVAPILDHHVWTLFILHDVAIVVFVPRWDSRDAIQRSVTIQTITNVGIWRGFQSLCIGAT